MRLPAIEIVVVMPAKLARSGLDGVYAQFTVPGTGRKYPGDRVMSQEGEKQDGQT